jgi:hypothetical protein
MKIKISQVFTPSDLQKAKGIMGTANLAIVDGDDNPIVYLNGMTVRRTKDGKQRFLSMPSYSIQKGGETQYRNHFSMFPSSKESESRDAQRARMDSLTNDVLRILDNGGTHPNSKPAAPAAPATATATTPSWDDPL